jgi:hypothetical protein
LGETEADTEQQAQDGDGFARLFACLEDGEQQNLADYLSRLIAAAREQLSENKDADEDAETQDHRRHGPGRRYGRHGEEQDRYFRGEGRSRHMD